MVAQSQQLAAAISVAHPAPPLSAPVAAYGMGSRRKPAQRSKRTSPTRSRAHIPNPVKMFDHIVIHPVAWPEEALRWMGVPRRLPTVNTPRASLSGLAQDAMSAALRQPYDRVADTIRRGERVSREDLSTLVVEAFMAFADAQGVYMYRRAKAYLILGELRVRMEPLHGFSGSGVSPVLAYLDEGHRVAQRARLAHWRPTRAESESSVQDDGHVEVTDVAMLLAMAQEHKRWGVPANAEGDYITRVMYPNNEGGAMIVLTAATPAATLVGIQEGHDTLKRVRYSRQTVAILGGDGSEGWRTSPLLQLTWALVEEGGKLAEKTPMPKWPIGPWAWTTHF